MTLNAPPKPTSAVFPRKETAMKPKVLFLCIGNSARSPMAEGYLRHIAGENFEVLSAGISPKGIHPLAIEAMKEVGIDIRGQRSRDVQELVGTPIRFVVTVCSIARERCPIFPSAVTHIHWEIDDPAEAAGTDKEKLSVIRAVRDKVFAHINSFVQSRREFQESIRQNTI